MSLFFLLTSEYADAVSAKDRTRLAQEVATELLNRPNYKKMLVVRAEAGILPPQVEVLLWHYAFGKPVDRVEVNDQRDELKGKSKEELYAIYEAGTKAMRRMLAETELPELESVSGLPPSRELTVVKHFADIFEDESDKPDLAQMKSANKRPA